MQQITIAILVSAVLLLSGCVAASSEVRPSTGASAPATAYKVSGTHADRQHRHDSAAHQRGSRYQHDGHGRRGTHGYGRSHRSRGSSHYSSPRYGTSRYGSYRSRHKMLRHHYYSP